VAFRVVLGSMEFSQSGPPSRHAVASGLHIHEVTPCSDSVTRCELLTS
jgi:hypothetical protein